MGQSRNILGAPQGHPGVIRLSPWLPVGSPNMGPGMRIILSAVLPSLLAPRSLGVFLQTYFYNGFPASPHAVTEKEPCLLTDSMQS